MIHIPTISGETLSIEALPGAPIVIVGPNGSGKSALGGIFQAQVGISVNRIFAHRRIWLNASSPEMSPAQLQEYSTNFNYWNSSIESRWKDHADSARVSIILQDILDRQNGVNGLIADRIRRAQEVDGLELDGPLQLINRILLEAALGVTIAIAPGGELVAVNTGGASYPIAEMSDGEKAALLLAGDVLVADGGSFHIIDEPERHLHRSISASLITSLISLRSEDMFVVLTHDLELAMSLGLAGRTFVLNGCTWSDKTPSAWSISELPQGESLPEELRRAVLGGRTSIVFHEGITGGLDHQLYESLLRGWAVVAAGNCSGVLRSVGGLQAQESLHWLSARGIVDKDFRRDNPPSGVVHLHLHEVENVFYHSDVLQHMAQVQAKNFGKSAAELLRGADSAMRAALAVNGVRANIIRQRCLQSLRDGLTDQVATLIEVSEDTSVTLSESVDLNAMGTEYDAAIGVIGNIDAFLKTFPVRESGLRRQATAALFYPSVELYEQAVIQQIKQNPALSARVLALTGLADLVNA